MIKTFIERPVLSTVVSIIIVILGILGILSLPVTTYPDIAPPTVSIRASYPGANAETVLRSVVIPLENEDSFSVFSAASGLMAAHHQWVGNIATWMQDQGVRADDAAKYATQMVRALTEIEIRTPAAALPKLADECTTVGGLNEQAIRELRELDWFQQSSERLSRLLSRLKKGL